MEQHLVKVTNIERVTHDVLRIAVEKPKDYHFIPGQATEIAIDKGDWRNERRPFTFTSLPSDGHLEFTIKTYPAHQGVTNALLGLKVNDQLILHEVFGTIAYEGDGTFIAGGAGVTPFISILRSLRAQGQVGSNKLIFANKTRADIILDQEFKKLLGVNFINILADEKVGGYAHGFITAAFLKDNIVAGKKIYLCGPDPMMEAVERHLSDLGIDAKSIIKEAF